MAHGVCLWDKLFLGGGVCGLCWSVWLEIWIVIVVDRCGQCYNRLATGVDGAWPSHEVDDAGREFAHDARLFRYTLQ